MALSSASRVVPYPYRRFNAIISVPIISKPLLPPLLPVRCTVVAIVDVPPCPRVRGGAQPRRSARRLARPGRAGAPGDGLSPLRHPTPSVAPFSRAPPMATAARRHAAPRAILSSAAARASSPCPPSGRSRALATARLGPRAAAWSAGAAAWAASLPPAVPSAPGDCPRASSTAP
jgi:hypothetical protein